MKRRDGFVSNSSSSSFIIGDKNDFILNVKIDLKKFGTLITNFGQLDAFFKADPEMENMNEKEYFDCRDLIAKGKKILVGTFDEDLNFSENDYGVPAHLIETIVQNTKGMDIVFFGRKE